MTSPVLYSIGYSPWSVRARMALDLAGVPYQKVEYTPVVSELALRLRLRRWTGLVTVPVLFGAGEAPLNDSLDIARWASEQSGGSLFPSGHEPTLLSVHAHANALLEAGRLRTTRRVLANPGALRESLPPALRALGPVGDMVGRRIALGLIQKYGTAVQTDDVCLDSMAAALAGLRAHLAGRDTVLDALSWADITGAASLAFVLPHATTPIGPISRAMWTEPDLAAQHADLLGWRDRVMQAWKAARSPRS